MKTQSDGVPPQGGQFQEERQGLRWLETLLRNVRFGMRMLFKNPGLTAVAVLTLALGIGANTAIFSVVYGTLLAPMPYPNPNQLVMVWSKIQGNRNGVSAGDFLDWKRQSTVFQDLNAWTGGAVSLSAGERPEQVDSQVETPGFITMMGVPFFLGRDFRSEEGDVGKDNVVILCHKLWEKRFGGDRNIIGRQIRIDGKLRTVVGVTEAGPYDRLQAQLYLPLTFKPEQINHDFHFVLVMGRLKPGVSLQQANANMEAVTRHIAEVYPKSNQGWGATVEQLQNDFLSPIAKRGLWLLLGAVGFVLLIACANVANLLLARGMTRQREIAVRTSLGAAKKQLFLQFITESVVLAGIGGALGVALASVFMNIIMVMMPPYTLPSEAEVRLSVPVLLFTLVASMVSGVLFGCAPAWQATRQNLNETLKEGSRSSGSGGRHRLRRALVVTEFALALSLLAGGGLAIHSLWKLTHVNLGFRTDHLLTFGLPVPDGHLTQPEQINNFYRQLIEKIQALPGVSSASVSTGMPVQGTNFGMPFYFAGKPFSDPSARPGAGFSMVTPDYYRTFGIHIDRGRAFTEQDKAGGIPVAIVNATFAKRYLAGVDPLTQRIVVEQLIPGVTKLGPPIEWQIVGVYSNVRNAGPRGDGFPEINVPFWQSPWPGAAMAVRTAGDPAALYKSIAAEVQSMDPNLPMADVLTMDQIVDRSLAGDRFGALLFGGFSAMALLLAVCGIYGVMSFTVAQRTHEIGLRMALGASREKVLQMVMSEGMVTALIGALLGFGGAYLVGRAMQGMLYEVGTLDFTAVGAVAGTLIAFALLACYVPARRAARVDPLIALRYE